MKKLWLAKYPAGVPEEIDLNIYTSLVDMLERSTQSYVSNIAY